MKADLSLQVFKVWILRWSLTALGLLLFLFLGRLTAMFYFGGGPLLASQPGDLARAYLMGLRFDTVSVSYGLVLPTLAFLAWLFFPFHLTGRLLTALERVYFVLLVSLVVFLTLIDLGYYSYFQDHINVLIFGFFEDDTMALIRTFQKNYPFYSIISAALVFVVALSFLATKIFKARTYQSHPGGVLKNLSWKTIVAYLILIPLIGLGGRGSIGLFPLHEIDAAVSPNPFINYLAYSGLHGLTRAFKVRAESKSVWNSNGQYYGYENWQQAASVLYDKPLASLPQDPIQLIAKTTAKNIWAEKTSPHVVVLLLEGWGGYWMQWNSENFNVLGELSNHFAEDNVLMNFLPSMTATIGSLSALMVNSPHRPEGNFLSESRYMQVPFRFSPAPIFKKAGYKTRFIYGGGIGWRTVDRFAKVQGFDTIEGDFSIEERFGKIEKHDWGIYDGDVFRYIKETLEEAKEPQFIFVMTTTNHPPYQVPSNYQAMPLQVPPALQALLTSDAKLTADRFRVYQYLNRELGQFITSLKTSKLGERTIVAASGDHGFLLKNFPESELLQKWQTPFYLYLPKATHRKVDPQTFGSHIDIFPTLFELSLSEVEHYSFGTDLFDPKADHKAFHFSRLALSQAGAVIAEQKASQYYKWAPPAQADHPFSILESTADPSPELLRLDQKYRAMMGMLDYFYEYELEHSKRSKEESLKR